VEITRHEVQTVRRRFQEFKYPISDYLKCLVSRMRTGTDFLQNYFRWLSSFSLRAGSRLQFVGWRSTRAFTVHCFTFRLVMFKLRPFRVSNLLNLQEPCVLYIGRANRYPPNTPFYISFQQISVLNILNKLHTLCFFSPKCRLFHTASFFGSCIIRILHTGCAKI
jgi:hypothetical protein